MHIHLEGELVAGGRKWPVSQYEVNLDLCSVDGYRLPVHCHGPSTVVCLDHQDHVAGFEGLGLAGLLNDSKVSVQGEVEPHSYRGAATVLYGIEVAGCPGCGVKVGPRSHLRTLVGSLPRATAQRELYQSPEIELIGSPTQVICSVERYVWDVSLKHSGQRSTLESDPV